MENETNHSLSTNALANNLQDYLSIGYIYILVLGIASNLLYYAFFDINIVNYSTVLDILLSPFSVMSDSVAILILILATPFLAWILYSYQLKKVKKAQEDTSTALSPDEYAVQLKKVEGFRTTLPFLFVFGALVGFTLGKGHGISNDIEAKEHEVNYLVTFLDGQQDSIKLIGQNSQYIFYAFPNETVIKASPIQGNIKRLEKTKP